MAADWHADTSVLARQIELDLLKEHGPMLSGQLLSKTLGYSSMAAFRQACCRGKLPIAVFPLEHRRGKYALIKDVAQWLAEQRMNATSRKLRTHLEGGSMTE